MPKHRERFEDDNVAGQYEKDATELIAEAIRLEQQASAEANPESAAEYRAKAQELRNKALEALQIRRNL